MSKFVLALAAIGFSVSVAGACEFQRSAKAATDPTVVASVTQQSTNMSTPTEQLPQAEQSTTVEADQN